MTQFRFLKFLYLAVVLVHSLADSVSVFGSIIDLRPIEPNATAFLESSPEQGAHPDVLTEWQYLSGHLTADSGAKFGYELSFFRFSRLIHFVHFAITDERNKTFKFQRKYYLPAEVLLSTKTTNLKFGSTQIEQTGSYSFKVRADMPGGSLDLNLSSQKEPLIFNHDGLVKMPDGHLSNYYSLTRLTTSGQIELDGQKLQVSGTSWFDHQWGNFKVEQGSWDWFSFQMDDDTDYLVYSFRDSVDKMTHQFFNVLDKDSHLSIGRNLTIRRVKWWESDISGKLYATQWEVEIPGHNETFLVEASMPQQELYPTAIFDLAPTYWEGSCRVTKQLYDGRKVSGACYVEQFPWINAQY